MLKRSAQEAGFDDRNLNALSDITRPQLYPPFRFHSSGKSFVETVDTPVTTKRTVSQVYNVRKQRELSEQFIKSPFHVQPFLNVDIYRYGQKKRGTPLDVAVLERIGKKVATDPRYCPPELVSDGSIWNSKDNDDGDEDQLLHSSPAPDVVTNPTSAPPGEEDNEIDHPKEPEEEEEVEDYTTNYYDSADEDSFNEAGEATF